MVFTMYRDDLPDWAKSEMMLTCKHCGSYIVDNSDTGVTTARWCLNPKCPGHMAEKANDMAKMLGVKDVGPKTLLSAIKGNKYDNHFQLIPVWFGDSKPTATLPEIAVMAGITGYGAPTANQELSHYSSFENYFSTAPVVNPLLSANKDLLVEAQKYFIIKPPLSPRKMLVMGTGSFHNYNSREEFFRIINEAYGMYINVIQTGKRKTGISYLIKEYDAVDHSKSQIAQECGIPIVTPTEFVSIIASMCPYSYEE